MGSRNNNNNNGTMVPTSSKKVIQSIKEIVNVSDDEIYLMLKDCNMDAYEAVNRLLSQDTFHEVKSKREKKKEVRDVTDSRPRGSSASTRGGRGGYSSRTSTNQFGSTDYAAQRGKPVYKEVEPPAYTNSTVGVQGNDTNKWQTAMGDTPTDKKFLVNAAESILPTPQPSGFHPAWSGMPGQVSMADIVKMGRQPVKSQRHMDTQQATPSLPVASAPYDSGNAPPSDEWVLNEEPPASMGFSAIEHPIDSEPYCEPYDRTKQQQFSSQADDVQFEEDDIVDEEQETFVEEVPGSNQNTQENNSVTASGFDDDQYENIGAYQVHHHQDCGAVEDPNVSVSSMTNNFEGLSLTKDDEETQSEDDSPTVKIPDHLQVQTADLSHLSFGSFSTAPFFGSFASKPANGNEEEAAVSADAPSVGHSEVRNSEYYEDDHIRTAEDGNNVHRMDAGSGNFDSPSVSQTNILQQEAPEAAQVNQYSFPSSTATYTFENNQQSNLSFAQSPASSQMMQGLPSLAGGLYNNALPSTLLASNMQALREADPYSQFPVSQPMAAKYGNSVSSLSGPAASMAEALKSSNLGAQTTQGLPGGTVSGASGLPQHLAAMHPYSQHSVPVGPLNMMGYPFLHPYTQHSYMPSAFQQAFAAGNNAYPQSLAAMLPQYKNSVSVSSLPQSAYGGFGNSNNVPSNFPLNPQSAPPGNSINYDDVLASQYKDASYLLSLQQGPESRTMSGVPGNTYYSFQGQNQQPPAGFRQNQQPSQHYGAVASYPNYYQSQGGGPSLEHHQQMSRDGSLGGSQGQQSKQTQQHLWQNTY